jgi:hypothetical protein
MKWLFDSLPFIEPYPTWIKALISVWLVFTAVCIAALLIAQPAKNSNQGATTWLKISGVSIGSEPGLAVRVYAKVNGTTYTYPSIGGVEWVEPSPGMAVGSFKIASAATYEVTFTMDTNRGDKYASQEIIRLRQNELPAPRSYSLYSLTYTTRSGRPSAAVHFSLTPD